MKTGKVLSFLEVSVCCPSCDNQAITTRLDQLGFDYGPESNKVKLVASVPVYECEGCGFSFTDARAEELIHEAICKHLGVLTPREIRGVRENLEMSRADFATLTHFGEASLARWESGALIQNKANDQLLYLLTFDDNVSRLKNRSRNTDEESPLRCARGVFRVLSDLPRFRQQAARFKLRK
jgi:putative zinc finger/helix-turn-helix YgiT family protein